MGVVATTFQPSTTNNVGTAFGTLIGGMAMKWLIAAPFVAKVAATPFAVALGLTPMGLAGIGGVLATGLATYAATHIAEVREAAQFLAAIPNTYSSPTDFPNPPPQVQTPNNLNKGAPP